MNELILAYRADHDRAGSGDPAVNEPMRLITPLVLSPSEDLALVAQRFAHRMPRMVRVPPRRLRGDRLASLPRDTRNKARYETGDPIHVVDARAPASGVRA